MAKFIVRVELHDARHGDQTYEHLHAEMESAGFNKTVHVNGRDLQLPPAEYLVDAKDGVTKKDVYDAAKLAAQAALRKSRLSTDPDIVVAEVAGGLYVGGLDEAD
jgi:hypothetical protein